MDIRGLLALVATPEVVGMRPLDELDAVLPCDPTTIVERTRRPVDEEEASSQMGPNGATQQRLTLHTLCWSEDLAFPWKQNRVPGLRS